MSLISKKDVDLLLEAGFEESDLGLSSGAKLGITVYESPEDYFARELIENAAEQGLVNLYDDVLPPTEKVKYDDSHKGLYDDQEYPGNDDPMEDVPQHLREQVSTMLKVKIGKMGIWQKRDAYDNYKWPVKQLVVNVPDADKQKMKRMSREDSKALWMHSAKKAWKDCWQAAIDSMWAYEIDSTKEITAKSGKQYNMFVIPADNLRKIGFNCLPAEASWITMLYFDK